MLEDEREKLSLVVEAAITAYYDNLTPEEQAEERAWGDFATAQFLLNAEIDGSSLDANLPSDNRQLAPDN